MGHRKRWALDASGLLRVDPLLEKQPELGVLGTERALRFLGFRTGRFQSARPHRKDRLRQRHWKRRLTTVRCNAFRGRLPVRRLLVGEADQAAWISYSLVLDRLKDWEAQIVHQLCAGRCMASGGPESILLPPTKWSDKATHAERVALSSMVNFFEDARRIQGGVLLHTSGSLCISCLAAFCHCKRLFPQLRFEISWDPLSESQRWAIGEKK
ncbi:unnamed protein product [Durusdinium trenchii]